MKKAPSSIEYAFFMVVLFLFIFFMAIALMAIGKHHVWDYILWSLIAICSVFPPIPFIRAVFSPWSFDETKVEVGSWHGLGRRVFCDWSKIVSVKGFLGAGFAYILAAEDKKVAWVLTISYSKKDLKIIAEIVLNVQKSNPKAEISQSLLNRVAGI